MRIGIVGLGRMGSNLARALARAGYRVYLGSRSMDKARKLAEEINSASGEERAHPTDYVGACREADIVVLAVPYRDIDSVARVIGGHLDGKIVIDITNVFDPDFPYGKSSAQEENAKRFPKARIVGAFKTNFYTTLLEPKTTGGVARDVYVASDHEDAKRTVIEIVRKLGFNPVDAGSLRNCRVLDLMVHLMIELDQRLGYGFKGSWKFLPP